MEAAYREIEEETGLSSDDIIRFEFIVKSEYPSGTVIYFYFGVLKEGANFKQVEAETLGWYKVKDCLDVTNDDLAGDGNIPYFLTASMCELTHEQTQGR